MVHVQEIIVVEGKYDKNALSQVVDATIVCTDGFAVFNNKRLRSMLHKLAAERGVIVLTDSDGAGRMIRSYLNGIIEPDKLKNAFIPDIYGKEKRKSVPSKEGKLGVEGMTPEILLQSLSAAGATLGENSKPTTYAITKSDLFRLGLLGCAESAEKRKIIQKYLDLPEHMSSNQLVQVLSILMPLEKLEDLVYSIKFA